MKKIFSLFAAVLMAGSMMAGNWIKFEEPATATEVAGSTYGSEGFTLEIPATSDKASIDANSCTFGLSAEETVTFTHRLKTGGASSKAGRKFTLNIPEEGPLVIYARTSKATATDRNFVIANGSDTIVDHICLDTDTVEGASSKIFLPVIVENVPAGTYEVTYPVDGINFYGFQLGYDEPAELVATPSVTEFSSLDDLDGMTITFTGTVPQIDNEPGGVYLANPDITAIYAYANRDHFVFANNVATISYFDTTMSNLSALPTEECDLIFLITDMFVGQEDMIIMPVHFVPGDPTALENTNAEVKAAKTIENGQVIIIRDGVRYNVLGAQE